MNSIQIHLRKFKQWFKLRYDSIVPSRFILRTFSGKVIPLALTWVRLYFNSELRHFELSCCISTQTTYQSSHANLFLLGRYLVQTVVGSQFPSQTLLHLPVSRKHTGRQPFVSIQIKYNKEVLQSGRNTFVRSSLIFLRCVLCSCLQFKVALFTTAYVPHIWEAR